MTECSSTEVPGKEEVDKGIKMGKLFPVLSFITLIFSTTAESWKTEEDQFNSAFEWYCNKVQNDTQNDTLIQYRKFCHIYYNTEQFIDWLIVYATWV